MALHRGAGHSFHCGVPLPPDLGVVMLKRFWSGEMTNEKIDAELKSIEPGMILLRTDKNLRPFAALIATEYWKVYQDDSHRLYVHKSIADKVDLQFGWEPIHKYHMENRLRGPISGFQSKS
jgi:hypothetical protein